MNKLLGIATELVAPPPETLWERGNAEMRATEIYQGRYENVPFFNVSITNRSELTSAPLYDDLERQMGTTYTRTYITSDGIDRATRIHVPENEHRNTDFNFVVQLNTAWFTSIDGHNDETASFLAKELGVPVIEIGAEHSSRQHTFLLDFMRLPKVASQSKTISLAKTAQSSQLITADICEEFNLPSNVVKIGESRGAMVAPAEYVYAPLYDNTILYTDTTAPCLPDKLFSHESDIKRLGQWPTTELIGAAVVGIEAAKQRAASKLLGTVSLNPNFLYSSVVGIGPALASGEAGRFAAWVPEDQATGNIHIVTFKNDVVSRPNTWKTKFANHPGVAIITLEGTHVTLAHTDVLRHLVGRIRMFAKQYAASSEDITKVNWNLVHIKDDDLYLEAA